MTRYTKTVQKKTRKIIDLINQQIEQYGRMTVRQVYYRLVTLGFKENPIYNACKVGRWHGLIDLDAIVDRSRPSYGTDVWESKKEVQEWLSKNFKLDYWKDNKYRVEIWTEKDALSEVLSDIASSYRVPVRVTKGFLSTTKRYRWGGKNIIILYVGDFDPSGLYMDEDLQKDRFLKFASFERVALTTEQIKQYDLPSIPVKLTDSRAKRYVAEHGRRGWEVDALEPNVLQELVKQAIEKHITFDLDEKIAEEQRIREEFKEIS